NRRYWPSASARSPCGSLTAPFYRRRRRLEIEGFARRQPAGVATLARACVPPRLGLPSCHPRNPGRVDPGPQEAVMALRVMSADSHMDLIYLPTDTFTSRMAARWGDATPHVVERDGRKWWVSRDSTLGPYGVYGPGVTGGKRGRILAEAGFATGKQTRPSNPVERREDQDRDGVQAEVIYGIIGISRGLFTHSGIADRETLAAVQRVSLDYSSAFN